MQIILHRRNTINELISTPQKYGIEVDIRSYGEHLVIHHDPFIKGELFEDWIKNYNHQTLILNIKEEGLESNLIQIMNHYKINDYFFLDQSFPFLIKWSNLGERRCAVRISEFESIETAINLSGKVQWTWIDCFTKFPLTKEDFLALKRASFKTCLVSPELQGKNPETSIPELINFLDKNDIIADAVCTKRADLWETIAR